MSGPKFVDHQNAKNPKLPFPRMSYPLVMTNILKLLDIAIEKSEFPNKSGWIFYSYVNVYQRVCTIIYIYVYIPLYVPLYISHDFPIIPAWLTARSSNSSAWASADVGLKAGGSTRKASVATLSMEISRLSITVNMDSYKLYVIYIYI